MTTSNWARLRPARAARHARARHTLNATGVEVDGKTLRVITIRDGNAGALRTYTGESAGDAIAAWVSAERPKKPIRVATSAASMFATTTFPAALPAKVIPQAITQRADEAFTVEASDRLTAGAISAASTDEDLRSALICIPRSAVEDLWSPLRKVKAQLAPSALLLQNDGMHLHTGVSGSSLSLVEDGLLAEHHPCSVGEIDWDDPDVLQPSPHSAIEMLVAECVATAQSWTRIGHEIPQMVFVSGPGASEPTLLSSLQNIGLTVTLPPPPPGVDTGALSPADLAAGSVALAAAAVVDSPTIFFFDPDAEVIAERSRHAMRRQIAAVSAVVVFAGLAAGIFGIVQASAQLARAKAAKEAATTRLATVERTLIAKRQAATLTAEVARIVSASPSFGPYITKMLASAPPGTTWTGFSVQGSQSALSFQVSAILPGTSFLPISTWISGLEATGATPVTVPAWSASTKGVSVSLSATYPLKRGTP